MCKVAGERLGMCDLSSLTSCVHLRALSTGVMQAHPRAPSTATVELAWSLSIELLLVVKLTDRL